MKILRSTVTKKVIVLFYNLGEKFFFKVTAFLIFLTSIMVLNKLCVSLKDTRREKALSNKTPVLTKSRYMGIWVVGISNLSL